ncbi:hypothetical protein C8R44DRAFT_890184 [Mycena epipterygia]|nr:hypothetical protein C8R44DRAFT_890184 [Mycena epipterygia]
MSLFVQGLRALHRGFPTLPFKTPEFRDLTMEWLGDLSTFDPAARELWLKIKDGFEGRKVLFREVYPSGKPGIPPFTFNDETVFDCFHAFALFQQILEKRFHHGPNFIPSSFLGAVPAPTDEAHRRWSLLSQHALKLVGGGVMTDLLASTFRTSQPGTIQMTFVPHVPRAWELGYSLPGRGEGKAALQQYLKAELIRKYPTLKGWVEPLCGGGLKLGHCAEARPWLRILWLLRNGGTAWAMAATPQHLSLQLPSGAIVWEVLISHVVEQDFLRDFTKEIPSAPAASKRSTRKSKTTTCSCEFCGNCDGAAEKINLALGCDLVDLAPLLEKAGLHPLLMSYTTNAQRVLLGPTAYERVTMIAVDGCSDPVPW